MYAHFTDVGNLPIKLVGSQEDWVTDMLVNYKCHFVVI